MGPTVTRQGKRSLFGLKVVLLTTFLSMNCAPEAPVEPPAPPPPAKPDYPESTAPMRPPSATHDRRRNREPASRRPSVASKDLLPRYQGEMIEGASALYSGDFDRARGHYVQAMRLKPDRMAAALGALRTMLTRGHGNERANTESVVRERVADLETIPEAEGAAHLLSARLAIALQRPGAALDAARLAVEHMPTHGVAWRVLGEAAILAEHWGRAQEALQRAANLGLAAKAGTWERLANVLDELGELPQAEAAARRAVELTGSDLHAKRRRLNLLGAVLKHRGKLDDTGKVLERARELGAKDPAVLHNIATLAEAQGNHDEAVMRYQEALELGSSPMSSWRYGHLLLKLDRPQEAVEAFTAAAATMERWTWPRSTRWWPAFEVGKMYAKNGHEKQAVPWFEDALRETNTVPAARSVRSWLSFSRVKSGTYKAPQEEP